METPGHQGTRAQACVGHLVTTKGSVQTQEN